MMSEEHGDLDAALAQRARIGDVAAFVKFAKRWWAPIYRFTWNMSGSTSFAAQATERTLMAALAAPEQPSSGALFAVFLYRVALDVALTRNGIVRSTEKPVDAVATLRSALQRLDPLDRASVVLAEVTQLPMEQISAVISKPADEARRRVYRSLMALTESTKTLDSMTRG